jgi:pyridoxine/pyridoxamine 5'-phosphate oxidase
LKARGVGFRDRLADLQAFSARASRGKESDMDPTIELSDDVRHSLEGKNFWHLATVNPTGSPQVTTVWVHTRDDKILVNSALGRVKPRNIEHNPRVALSWNGASRF